VAYNGANLDLETHLPKPAGGFAWYHVLDTSAWFEGKSNIHPADAEALYDQPTYALGRRAVAVFVERPGS
jgi:hypothetical protein